MKRALLALVALLTLTGCGAHYNPPLQGTGYPTTREYKQQKADYLRQRAWGWCNDSPGPGSEWVHRNLFAGYDDCTPNPNHNGG